MNVTNQHGLPDVFVRAVQDDPYDQGEADFSVTGLIGPPQIARLREEHEDKLSTDVSDEIWKLLGSGVHNILERHADGVAEKRYYADFNVLADDNTDWTNGLGIKPCTVRISGAVDVVDDGHVSDYKVTSAYTVKKGLKPEWEAQLNLYAWLLEENGIEPKSLSIVAICRDHQKRQAGKNGYPNISVVTLPVPMWGAERRERFLDQRVRLHTSDKTVPCTDEERWLNSSGTYVRCEGWCDVSEFCPQQRGANNGDGKTISR